MKPILKWAGGKSWIIPHIQPILDRFPDLNLMEPFAGGLAISLSAERRRTVVNDINPHVINFYRWVQRGLTPNPSLFIHEKEHYYLCRNRFNELIVNGKEETLETAVLFYYLNKSGFNGLCRFNSKGLYNVPIGRYPSINYRLEEFPLYKEMFKYWEFSCKDFEQLRPQPETLIVADPPYDDGFVSYSTERFSWDDQVRLIKWLVMHKGPVVATNKATERIIDLYETYGFQLEFADAPRNISAKGTNRQKVKEMIATWNLTKY